MLLTTLGLSDMLSQLNMINRDCDQHIRDDDNSQIAYKRVSVHCNSIRSIFLNWNRCPFTPPQKKRTPPTYLTLSSILTWGTETLVCVWIQQHLKKKIKTVPLRYLLGPPQDSHVARNLKNDHGWVWLKVYHP